jgi:hypothetical protein
VVTRMTYSKGFNKDGLCSTVQENWCLICDFVLRECFSFAAKGQNEVQKPGRRRSVRGPTGSKESKLLFVGPLYASSEFLPLYEYVDKMRDYTS